MADPKTPVDSTMWSMLQKRVYRTKISDNDELKRLTNSEWAALSHTVVECACAVGEWRQRLRACVRAGDGHFEYRL